MADYKFKKSYFDNLQDYIQAGSKEELTGEEEKYLEMLYLINSMRRKYGKENAISFIQRPPFNIPYRRSREMYDEALNLFYGDDNVEKQAHRNALFEEMIAASKLVLATAKSSRDMEVYADIVSRAYKIKGLDVPEPPKVPEGLYKKPIKIYSLNPAAISLQLENRHEIAAMIDKLEIEENEKVRIKQEAGVNKINFLELYDEQESKIESEP